MPSYLSLEHRLALPVGFALEQYRIVRVLGYGGFGITYLAEIKSQSFVAIKELFPRDFATRTDEYGVAARGSGDEEKLSWAKRRFIDEAHLLERLQHPYIVPVYSSFELLGTAYLVMKFISGKHLKDWIKEHPRPTEKELLSILLPLLDGLEYIHQQGFLHRDISPENVIVTDTGSPVLLDFGSARTLSAARKLTTVVRSGFSPIEQYQSTTPQGCFTDIYALAGTMVQAVTRKDPPQAVDRAGAHDPFKPLATRFRGRYSERFLLAIDRGFAVLPTARPQTVTAWRQMLIQAIRDPERRAPPLSSSPATVKPKAKVVTAAPKAKHRQKSKPRALPGGSWLLFLLLLVLGATPLVVLIADPGILRKITLHTSPTSPDSPPSALPAGPLTATIQAPFVNWLQMKFVPVSTTKDAVILFCIHQTRRFDFETIMGPRPKAADDPGINQAADTPITNVTQGEAKQFCEKLTIKDQAIGQHARYRLPSRAEWDAAYGNVTVPWPPVANGQLLGNYCDTSWFDFSHRGMSGDIKYISGYDDKWPTTAPVMSFPQNRNVNGLYDMGSNVEEWCDDPTPTYFHDSLCLFRKGASWLDYDQRIITNPKNARIADSETRLAQVGFRCVLELGVKK